MRREALGCALGLALGVLILSHAGASAPAGVRGRLLSESDGSLREIVIQYLPEAASITAAPYREFLRQLPADVSVDVICPDNAAFEELSGVVRPLACRLTPVLTGHAMTCWSRDRWLALEPEAEGGFITLLCPRGEGGANVWPARAGDERLALELAAARTGSIRAHRSLLYFDGGDFIADNQTVFITPAVIRRNLQHTVQTMAELQAQLQAKITQKLVWLEKAPDHHAGMFMALAGGGAAIVGDPSLAKSVLAGSKVPLDNLCGSVPADFSPETQELFDAVARQCAASGYRVVRIPVVPGCDGRTYLTYVNGIMDQRTSRRVVHMPVFAHVPELNRAAAEAWRSLGYEVRTVDCSSTYRHFGSLHCLVNVVSREK